MGIWHWKKFENQSAFAKFSTKNQVPCFLRPSLNSGETIRGIGGRGQSVGCPDRKEVKICTGNDLINLSLVCVVLIMCVTVILIRKEA